MPANEMIPFYEPGDRLTGHAAVALTGKRFCAITATRQSGPGLSNTAEGGNIVVGKPGAAGRVFGVLSHDVAAGGKVAVVRGSGFVVPVLAAGAITAFDEVKVDAEGRVVTHGGTGVAVGYAVADCANGAEAQISLYG